MFWGQTLGSLSLRIFLLLLSIVPALSAEEGHNVAREGRAFQSSTYNELGEAQNALDGSPSTNYLRGHCTHTQQESSPWWTVDLGAEFRVFRVSVSNRGDCCEERLNGAEIRIGNLAQNGGTTNPRCATISSLGPGETGSFACEGMRGRYVTVTIPGVQCLTVCEVQVFGVRIGASDNGTETSGIEQWVKETKTPREPLDNKAVGQTDANNVPNVAIGGKAFQSSTFNKLGLAKNAIDGSISGDFLRGSCTHTDFQSNPWWIVDLKAVYNVSSVRVSNREDCCEWRLNGAEIRVGNSFRSGGTTNPRCATISSLGAGETGSFDCRGMPGQYVTVTIPHTEFLTVCEVQVFGVRIGASGRDVASEGRAFQSSTYNALGEAENALDGSPSTNYLRGHCTHTKQESNPWWTVDLGAEFQIFRVSVTNRGDCCEERLNGAEVRIGNLPQNGGTTNPRCAQISYLGSGETGSFHCEGMKGRYVTVTIPGVQYLTVCEVQVFGVKVGGSGDLNTDDGTETSGIEQWVKETKLPREPLDDKAVGQTDANGVPNVATGGKAFQSSTFNKLGLARNAIDGSISGDFLQGSCIHTDFQSNPWWTVDLKDMYNVSSVRVSNREDCCEWRLNGAEIRVGNSFRSGGTTNPRCATISSLGAGETGSFDCRGMPGRYVTVTIPHAEFLTVCEVQVFGVKTRTSGV